MPVRVPKLCSQCKQLYSTKLCNDCKQQRRAAHDKQRGTAHQRGYTSQWRKVRLIYLKQNPLCVECDSHNKLTPASVIDHIIPHKGNKTLFWDKDNWQSLCKPCHDTKTALHDGGFKR